MAMVVILEVENKTVVINISWLTKLEATWNHRYCWEGRKMIIKLKGFRNILNYFLSLWSLRLFVTTRIGWIVRSQIEKGKWRRIIAMYWGKIVKETTKLDEVMGERINVDTKTLKKIMTRCLGYLWRREMRIEPKSA